MDIIVTDIYLQFYISIETTPTLLGACDTLEKKRMLETGHPVFKVGAVCRREVFLTALKGRNGVTVQKNHAPPATYKTLQIIGYLPYQLVLAGFFSISQYESPTTPENSHF